MTKAFFTNMAFLLRNENCQVINQVILPVKQPGIEDETVELFYENTTFKYLTKL